MTPVPVPPGYPGLPDRDASTAATPRQVLPRTSSVPIDVHGSLDRAKDVSSIRESRLFGVTAMSACAWRTLTTFPSSFFQRTPVVAGATDCLGTSPTQTSRTDQDPRSTGNPRRLPASRRSGCLPPLQQRARERITPLRFPCRPPAHAAHTLPPWLGTMCLVGHCKRHGRDEPGA